MINKYSSIPLYSQLKNLIIEKIEKGEYTPDSKIPSEQELCESFDISRPTVRQAINELTSKGYLYKEKGKGTFVNRSKYRIDIRSYSGFTDSILDSQTTAGKDFISFGALNNGENGRLNEVFNLSTGQMTEFAELKYLTKLNNEIMSLNSSYIPLNLFPNIIDEVRESRPSFDILKGKYPLIPAKTKSSLEIIYTDQSDAQYLQVQQGHPLIQIENILFSKSGQIVEYILSKYRADKCRLVFENTK